MINGDEGGDQRVENVGRNGRQIWMIGWKIFTNRGFMPIHTPAA